MSSSIKLRILYWNANSIAGKIIQFYDLLTQHDIDVACVCETYLKELQHLHSHPDYIMYRVDRDHDIRGGGVLIVVRRSISHSVLPTINTRLLESIGITINTENQGKIDFFSIYLPGGSSNNEIRNLYAQDLRKITQNRRSYFAAGDFNSKHRLWNCSRANVAGNILFSELNNNNFMVLHPFGHTHFPVDPNKIPSTIDLVLTNGLHATENFQNLTLNSDHTPVYFEINVDDRILKNESLFHRAYFKADWEKFRRIITYDLRSLELQLSDIISPTQIDNLISRLTESMLKAQNISVPLVRKDKYFIELTPDIKEDIKIRNIYTKRWQRTRNPDTKRFVNIINASIKQRILELRNINWSHKLQSLSHPENRNQLWKTAKFLKNKNQTIPPLKENGQIYLTSQEKTDILAENFASYNDNPLKNDNPSFTSYINSRANEIVSERIEEHSILYPSEEELKTLIGKMKSSKAPGNDKIHNKLLKQLPSSGVSFLNLIFMACLKLSYFPEIWKTAKVIALQKPGKDPCRSSSYRPISLLSSFSKLFERIILTRINSHLRANNILPPEQHGFRTGFSTVHQLLRIKNDIKSKYEENKSSTGMIFMDVEKAFDRVWHQALIYKLLLFGFPLFIIKIVHSFLKDRKFFVNINGALSILKLMEFGLPQGAVLSPNLYGIFTSDFPVSNNCSRAFFADDTTYYSSSPFLSKILSDLREFSHSIDIYFKKWKINLNKSKTQALFFTKRRTREVPNSPLNIFNTQVEWQKEAKYLGIILDSKLTFKKHIDFVIEKINKIIKIYYPIINRKSKLSLDNKLLLYKVCFRSIMTYGSPVFSDAANTHLHKLQIQQNKFLKNALDVPWHTNTNFIHETTNIMFMKQFIIQINQKFLSTTHN